NTTTGHLENINSPGSAGNSGSTHSLNTTEGNMENIITSRTQGHLITTLSPILAAENEENITSELIMKLNSTSNITEKVHVIEIGNVTGNGNVTEKGNETEKNNVKPNAGSFHHLHSHEEEGWKETGGFANAKEKEGSEGSQEIDNAALGQVFVNVINSGKGTLVNSTESFLQEKLNRANTMLKNMRKILGFLLHLIPEEDY
ncbi:unnamed protein product, partial [Meganyctiphanes norvegica]